MAWVQHRSRVLVVAFWAVCAGCAPSAKLGPPKEWVPIENIDGQFKTELLQPGTTTAGQSLRLVTFNLHYAEDTQGISAALEENEALARADILVFEEIRNITAEGSSRASRIAAALGMGYIYAPAHEVTGGTHGLAILTRFPLENVAVMELPFADLPLASERRIALSADIRVGDDVLHVIGVHLDTRLNPSERILQLRPAVLTAPATTVVLGDFNTNPVAWAMRTVPTLPVEANGGADQSPVLDSYMQSLDWRTPTASFGATVSYPLLKPRLDSIYVRGLQSGAGAVERGVNVSDHWPVWLDVARP